MQSWANYIARFRRTLSLTQRDAAALLEVSQATLSRWEAGKQVPTLAERRRIQQRVEAVTGEARRLLVALVRASPVPLAIVDERLQLLAASGPLLRLFGLQTLPEAEARLQERLFGEDLAALERLLSGTEEGELLGVDMVTEVVGPEGSRLPLRQFWVRFVCGLGQVLYRIEVAPLDPAEYEARLTGGRRFSLLRPSDLVGSDKLGAGKPFVYG